MQKSSRKRNKKSSARINALHIFLPLFVILASVLLLSSCSKYGGSSEILSKEELLSNSSDTDRRYDYVCEYLDSWDFPTFDIKKIREIENKFLTVNIHTPKDASKHATALAEVFVSRYYDKTDLSNPSAVTDSIIKAYAETSSDEYAKYYSADEYVEYLNKMSGTICDVGLRAEIKDGRLSVVEVYEQMGAFDAGIIPGDVILTVDGMAANEKNHSELYGKLSGPEGTYVQITVERRVLTDEGEDTGETKTRTFSVQRKPTVSYYLNNDLYNFDNDGIGFIKISAFKENTPALFKQAVDYMLSNGAKGIIFDVRDNRGGYLDAAIEMLEYIIPLNKTLVTYKDKNGAKTVIRVMDFNSISIPCAVLCDENTASAGELFASVMRDYSTMNVLDSCLVGETTYGKGVLQDTFLLSDGSALTMTSANYYPPSDVSFNGVGIEPEIKVSNSELDNQNSYDRQKERAIDQVTDRIAIYYSKLPKEEFLSNLLEMINKPQAEYEYMAQYFRAWGMPICDMTKLRAIQDIYMEQTETPYSVFEHAKKAALIFVDEYYESVKLGDRSRFTDALITSWIKSIDDEWAQYRVEEEFNIFQDDLYGKSIGLGITLDREDHVIINIFADSDAYVKGLMEGDVIYKVNGIEFTFDNPETSVNEDNFDEISRLLQGDANTSVEITVLRGGKEITVNVERKLIDSRTATYRVDYYSLIDGKIVLGDPNKHDYKIGYIEISSFKLNTAEQFIEAINKLELAGVDGYIFDLRSNTGGSLDAVIDIISYLVRENLEIVSFEYINHKYRAPIKSYGKHTIGKTPCAVLCNRYTASAGELFTAALRDYTDMGEMDAIIIGDVTYGKGVMQETQRLYDGSGITLTVATYYPPGGKDAGYHDVGITPDILTTNAKEQDARGVLEVVKKILANDADSEGDAVTDEAA